MKRHEGWFTLLLTTAAVGTALGTPAVATIPDALGRFHVCYKTSTGALRVIDDSTTSCRPDEVSTWWSKVGAHGSAGPPGPAGPQGAVGAPGAAGPTGAAGPQGVQGSECVQGPVGPAGAAGAAGPAGLTGPYGALGETGPGPDLSKSYTVASEEKRLSGAVSAVTDSSAQSASPTHRSLQCGVVPWN